MGRILVVLKDIRKVETKAVVKALMMVHKKVVGSAVKKVDAMASSMVDLMVFPLVENLVVAMV